MKYINTRTKAVITTASICSGGDWIPYEEHKDSKEGKPKKTPRKKTTKKGE